MPPHRSIFPGMDQLFAGSPLHNAPQNGQIIGIGPHQGFLIGSNNMVAIADYNGSIMLRRIARHQRADGIIKSMCIFLGGAVVTKNYAVLIGIATAAISTWASSSAPMRMAYVFSLKPRVSIKAS